MYPGLNTHEARLPINAETKYIIKEQFKEFKNTLSELELKVLALRIRGFKYEEIADRLKINFKTCLLLRVKLYY